MEVKGYKAFNKDITNRYGKPFELNKLYTVEGNISFGNKGNGFHFCKNIEDTLRYFDAVDDEIVLTEVTAFGEDKDIVTFEDEYNGYYDMYSARTIRIDRVIPRKELIEMFLTEITVEPRVMRFIQLFKLTEKEIEMFKLKYANSISIMNFILYYQENQKDVFEKQKQFTKKI